MSEEVIEIALCEQDMIFLRPNVLYRLYVVEDCPKCKSLEERYSNDAD